VINVKDKKLVTVFGLRVRMLRLERNLSQEKLANLADIPLSQIGRIERGEINATISTSNAIAKALKVQLYELFVFPVVEKKK
jgi:transcriptional regulator with XRE-family HTH domain